MLRKCIPVAKYTAAIRAVGGESDYSDEERIIDDAELATIQSDVRRKLVEAGLAGEPRLILKLEARY